MISAHWLIQRRRSLWAVFATRLRQRSLRSRQFAITSTRRADKLCEVKARQNASCWNRCPEISSCFRDLKESCAKKLINSGWKLQLAILRWVNFVHLAVIYFKERKVKPPQPEMSRKVIFSLTKCPIPVSVILLQPAQKELLSQNAV